VQNIQIFKTVKICRFVKGERGRLIPRRIKSKPKAFKQAVLPVLLNLTRRVTVAYF